MVQESGSKSNMKAFTAVNRNDTGYLLGHSSRKVSHEAVKQYDSSSKSNSMGKNADNAQKYGAWGPVYKNRDNFVNMHLF